MPRRIEDIRDEQLHVSHVNAAGAVNIASTCLGRISSWVSYVVQQPDIKDGTHHHPYVLAVPVLMAYQQVSNLADASILLAALQHR